MTLADYTLAPTRWLPSLLRPLLSRSTQRRTRSTIAHLDDRLRADVGLPPTCEHPLLPHEAAARIAVMAWR